VTLCVVLCATQSVCAFVHGRIGANKLESQPALADLTSCARILHENILTGTIGAAIGTLRQLVALCVFCSLWGPEFKMSYDYHIVITVFRW
jgi:hypothetical protein